MRPRMCGILTLEVSPADMWTLYIEFGIDSSAFRQHTTIVVLSPNGREHAYRHIVIAKGFLIKKAGHGSSYTIPLNVDQWKHRSIPVRSRLIVHMAGCRVSIGRWHSVTLRSRGSQRQKLTLIYCYRS